MALVDLMRHTAAVYSASYTKDSSGGSVLSYTLTASALPCNVQPAVSQIITDYKQRDQKVTHTLYWIDSTVTINVGQRVVYAGGNYQVVGLKKDTQRSFWFRADLESEQA